MTDLDQPAEPVDGRVARRQRNIDMVLDVVMEMFAEDAMFPTIEQAATRSGLSLRSLYRYFADPGELLEAVIVRAREQSRKLAHLHAIGEGPLDRRIDDFVAMRLRLYEARAATLRATAANAARHPRVLQERTRSRNELRKQFEVQFATELDGRSADARASALAAGDLLTQLDSIDYLRAHRGLSIAEIGAVLTANLHILLA